MIPSNLLIEVCNRIIAARGAIPYKERGITITLNLIKVTLEILNREETKTLPQLTLNDVRSKQADGLDRRIKEELDSDLRTGNIISDILQEAGIVDVLEVTNPATGRMVKGTKLREEWTWKE